jgi:MYXO-CTERM domain-containing protein
MRPVLPPEPLRRLALFVGLGLAGVMLATALAPALDRWATALFRDGAGFPAADSPLLTAYREATWALSLTLVAVAAGAWWVGAGIGRPVLWLPWRYWRFVFLLYVLGPGVVANLILKSHWGRARPAYVEAFGGTRDFTPWWRPSAECAANCSFVSGEAAGAAALTLSALVALWLLRRRLDRVALAAGVALAVAVPALQAALRVATGRHFLSDVVMAMLLTGLIAALLLRLLPLVPPPGRR